jgi:hypothetical protein
LWYFQHCSFSQYCLGCSWSFVFPNELLGRFFSLCDECHWDYGGNYIEHVDCFWWYSHFYYVDSANPWALEMRKKFFKKCFLKDTNRKGKHQIIPPCRSDSIL